MKLWVRIASLSVFLILAVLTSVGGLLFFAEKWHLMGSQVEQQNESTLRLSQVCVESTAEQNDLILLNYILSISKSPGVASASFINSEGKIVVHSDVNQVGGSVSGQPLGHTGIIRNEFLSPEGKTLIQVSAPVIYQGRSIGLARVEYLQEYFQSQINATLLSTMKRFCYVSGIAIFLGFLGSVLFAKSVTRPISILSEATRAVGKGELTHRISLHRNDELGSLARSFDEMTVKLQELDELKNDFVSSVSHELRSPLTALKGFLQMFQMGITGPLNDQQKQNVELMLECTDRLNRFVSDILDVAKLEAGMYEFDLKPIDPKEIAANIVTLFQPQAQGEKIQLILQFPERCPLVLSDADRLKQVFTNLISNAMKFTPEGGRVTVWLRDDGKAAKIGVSDTGVGIPKEAIGKLFNKFQQVKETKSLAKKKGTGLGLTIAKRIVEKSGGAIGVESELNKGTTFFFTLLKPRAA